MVDSVLRNECDLSTFWQGNLRSIKGRNEQRAGSEAAHNQNTSSKNGEVEAESVTQTATRHPMTFRLDSPKPYHPGLLGIAADTHP